MYLYVGVTWGELRPHVLQSYQDYNLICGICYKSMKGEPKLDTGVGQCSTKNCNILFHAQCIKDEVAKLPTKKGKAAKFKCMACKLCISCNKPLVKDEDCLVCAYMNPFACGARFHIDCCPRINVSSNSPYCPNKACQLFM